MLTLQHINASVLHGTPPACLGIQNKSCKKKKKTGLSSLGALNLGLYSFQSYDWGWLFQILLGKVSSGLRLIMPRHVGTAKDPHLLIIKG